MNSLQNHSYGSHESHYRSFHKRTKADWSNITIADSYKPNLDYEIRIVGQRKLIEMLKRYRTTIFRMTGDQKAKTNGEFVKMQIGPFFSNYPTAIGAHAALGLTCFLEYRQQVPEMLLSKYQSRIIEMLDDPAKFRLDKAVLEKVIQQVTNAVQARLILEELNLNNLNCCEIYRLFAASQNDMGFTFLNDIIMAVVIYSDVICWNYLELHPATQSIITTIQPVTEKYNRRLSVTGLPGFLELGIHWSADLVSELIPFLPDAEGAEEDKAIGFDPEHLPPLKKNSLHC